MSSVDHSNSMPPLPMQYRVAVRSDVGMRRANNQDSVSVVPKTDSSDVRFLIVADGMGAHAAGELASKMAADTVPHVFFKSLGQPSADALREAIREANDRVYAKGCSSAEFNGMGTTCSCLLLASGRALVGHVGDSRVYRLRAGDLEQLTFDHSLVWEMAAASRVSEDKVPAYIPKNVITRSLGPHESVNVDLEGPYPVLPGDVYLLCSDGLTGVVDDEIIASVLASLAPEEAAQTLVDLANLGGGPDNISVIVARAEQSSSDLCPVAPPRTAGGKLLWWGIAAACLLLCAFLGYREDMWGVLAAASVGGASLGIGLMIREANNREANFPCPALGSAALGNGPYRRVVCPSAELSAKRLAEIARELAEVTDQLHGTGELAQQLAAADQLLADNLTGEALASYAALIRAQMLAAGESLRAD